MSGKIASLGDDGKTLAIGSSQNDSNEDDVEK